jgi:antibiotic biosynthesis monooxygenase (ABM) superfamily enzyme
MNIEKAIKVIINEQVKPEYKKVFLSTKGEIDAMLEAGAEVHQETRIDPIGNVYHVYFVVVRFSSLSAIAR